MEWTKTGVFMLSVLKLLNYSPTYLSILRIMRESRVNNMIKFLERQKEYKLFKIDENEVEDKKKYYLKWTTTSDKSTLFLDIVREVEDVKLKLNWKMKFPQSFIICQFFFC